MKISFLLPTRNRVDSLKKCIESIENQTRHPDELIIILHEEDVKSREYIENIVTPLNIRWFLTSKGGCSARNLAIEKSSGDILAFTEDDVILEKNYTKNLEKIFHNDEIMIVAGYTFDLVDLTTPALMRRSEIELICQEDDEFYSLIRKEISRIKPDQLSLCVHPYKLKIVSFQRRLRNILKTLILQESPRKGRILCSGYRSEMPDIKHIEGLVPVQWFNGGNYALRKKVLDKHRYNEILELYDYSLGEDLELSAHLSQEYDIFLSKDLRIFHLRAPSGVRVDLQKKYKLYVLLLDRITMINGHKLGFWWSVLGLLMASIILSIISSSNSSQQIKGILEGIRLLKYNKNYSTDYN